MVREMGDDGKKENWGELGWWKFRDKINSGRVKKMGKE